MADVSKLTINDDEYDLKDAVARADIATAQEDIAQAQDDITTLEGNVETLDDTKVSKSGDTMTGGLTVFNGDVIIPNGSINVGTSGTSNYRGFRVTGTNTWGAILNAGSRMTFDQYVNGSVGGERYLLPTPDTRSSDAWYTILTNKNPVTTEQGGTGGTDSGDVNCTLGSGLTGDLVVRKLGKLVHFGMKLTTTGSLGANQYWHFGTIPADYRPAWNISIPAGDRDRWGSLSIVTTGAVTYFNCNVAIGANTTIYAYTFYLTP